MDQQKIGAFLKGLRKEKGFTQEQVAEQFGVSGRTVSRWENGTNMPDISIISEIADFYEVDIRELIEGERKKEVAPEEETVSKIIEYAGEERKMLSQKVMVNSIIGLVSLIVYVLISKYGLLESPGIKSLTESILLFFVYSGILYSISFTSGRLEKQLERRKQRTWKKIILLILFAIGVLLVLMNIMAALLVGAV